MSDEKKTTDGVDWEAIKQQLEGANKHEGGVCPNCGYCPHCGRGGWTPAPYYPAPYYPWNPQPYTITW